MVAFNPAFNVSYNPAFNVGGQPPNDGGGIVPTSIQGLQLWLDAADTSTLLDANGDPATSSVATGEDKSGNGNNATQGTASSRPATGGDIGGKNALTFDSGSDWLSANGLVSVAESEFTVFNVVKPASQGDIGILFSWQKFGDVANPDQFKPYVDTNGNIGIGTGQTNTIIDSRDWTDTPLIFTVTQSSTTVTSRINGAAANTNPTISAVPISGVEAFAIGQEFDGPSPGTPSNFYGGDMGELLIYDRVLSASEIQAVELYLANKYGITLS
jgi:hypothetical protein